ncbi:response regulator transcription factor [Paeniroseomonas aquatica]|uniref:Response regulator transcription factor n=1 Tax=Paeniroseomonas aquatica TaxID=373043 RepID=A0ABT8AAA8_9PROT|nr:response regulator transcription factor [Paeniroseomonas aquatica]MDN3566655.1 response regulator transcription factor [Paeniroseomonas aquatica]
MKILLVEDDPETAGFIRRGLTEAGHVVDHAADGPDGLHLAMGGGGYDVLVVDRMLPRLDGLGLVRALRAAGLRTPVLFLTARTGVGDRVEGLEAGADDYLGKPFAFAELAARLNALARRPPMAAEATTLRVADLEMDLLRRVVTRGGRRIELQPREFRLLEYLMRRTGQVVTRTMLLEGVWDFHFDPRTSVVETHVSRLRAKLGGEEAPALIHTMRGAGYVIRAPD